MTWTPLFIAILCTGVALPAFSKQHTPSTEEPLDLAAPSQCFFIPPQGWEIADQSILSPRVKIAFIKNTGKGFCPSLNLAIESTQVSLVDYLKSVKAIHEQNRSNHWRQLGKVRTPAGLAQLTEMDSTTEWGPIRILQLILVKEGHAYVLTAAALKEEFSNFYKEIQASFRSLTLTTDLLAAIPQLERKETLKQHQQQLIAAAREASSKATEPINLLDNPLFQEEHWLPFQRTILNNFSDMGAFWQVLFLREIQEKLIASQQLDIPPIDKN